MTEGDIRKMVEEELNNIAPEADLASLDPTADLREAIDIDGGGMFEGKAGKALARRRGDDPHLGVNPYRGGAKGVRPRTKVARAH